MSGEKRREKTEVLTEHRTPGGLLANKPLLMAPMLIAFPCILQVDNNILIFSGCTERMKGCGLIFPQS